MDAKDWLAELRALPNLMAVADAEVAAGGGDRYEVMRRLRDEHTAAGRPYVWTTAYRRPASPCSTGEHEVPAHTHELVHPALPGTFRLMIAEQFLHEIEAHGRRFSPDQVKKLEAIFDPAAR